MLHFVNVNCPMPSVNSVCTARAHSSRLQEILYLHSIERAGGNCPRPLSLRLRFPLQRAVVASATVRWEPKQISTPTQLKR
jgi:hypothetical protein